MIAAAAVLGECSIDLVGEPQWIVAVIFDLGHWVVPDAQWSFVTSRRRALNSGIGFVTGFEDFTHRFYDQGGVYSQAPSTFPVGAAPSHASCRRTASPVAIAIAYRRLQT